MLFGCLHLHNTSNERHDVRQSNTGYLGRHGMMQLFDLQAFDEAAQRTSTVPFQAIVEGRQQLPADYYKEFVRLPYLTITALTIGTYYAHPLMTWASAQLPW